MRGAEGMSQGNDRLVLALENQGGLHGGSVLLHQVSKDSSTLIDIGNKVDKDSEVGKVTVY